MEAIQQPGDIKLIALFRPSILKCLYSISLFSLVKSSIIRSDPSLFGLVNIFEMKAACSQSISSITPFLIIFFYFYINLYRLLSPKVINLGSLYLVWIFSNSIVQPATICNIVQSLVNVFQKFKCSLTRPALKLSLWAFPIAIISEWLTASVLAFFRVTSSKPACRLFPGALTVVLLERLPELIGRAVSRVLSNLRSMASPLGFLIVVRLKPAPS